VILDFIRGLLNYAGSDINVQQLIETIRNDLQIPGLRDSLCKIMQDYNIQVSAGRRDAVNHLQMS
jgi:vacuolar protein sorting-associated protein 41